MHELLHIATLYNGVYDGIDNVNNVLRNLRKELEYDEGLAGQIYRDSQAGKTLKLNDKNSRSDIIKAIQCAMGNFRDARTGFRDNISNTGESKAISDYIEARRREYSTPIGEHEQRE